MAEKEYIERETSRAKLILNDELHAADLIKSIPAADVRPVVRGRWIDGKCNQCGEHAPFWPMASTYYESNFCPDCGALMEDGNG